MLLKSFTALALGLGLAAAACSSDPPSAPAPGAAIAGDDSARGGAASAPRSGKIDVPPARPRLPGDPAAGSGDDDRRDRMMERRRDRMQQLDTDGDGAISDAERATARKARADRMHAELDANGDGKLTLDEVAAARRMRLDPSVDADGDGNVTADELDRALAERWARRDGFRGPRGQD